MLTLTAAATTVHKRQRAPMSRNEPTKATIAEMSNTEIALMNRVELIRVIRTVHVSLPQPEVERRLKTCDCQTLVRLAHLARRCCRNQGY